MIYERKTGTSVINLGGVPVFLCPALSFAAIVLLRREWRVS
jgi:hypothetical protein